MRACPCTLRERLRAGSADVWWRTVRGSSPAVRAVVQLAEPGAWWAGCLHVQQDRSGAGRLRCPERAPGAQGYAAALTVMGYLPRLSLLGAPNSAGARSLLVADLAAAAAASAPAGAGAGPGARPPGDARASRATREGASERAGAAARPGGGALPRSVGEPDSLERMLWHEDGTVVSGGGGGGVAAAAGAFVPCPPTNIHHALKRQRKLLSPADVPRLWALPRIAAELVVALADRAMCEERARGGRPTPSPHPNPAARAAPRAAPAPEVAAVGAAAVASGPAAAATAVPDGAGVSPCTGAPEAVVTAAAGGGARPRACAEAPATSAPEVAQGLGVTERERRGPSGERAVAGEAPAHTVVGVASPQAPDRVGEAGAAGAPAPGGAADAPAASEGTGAAPARRICDDAGTSSSDPGPARPGPSLDGGPGVAARLAHLVAGNVSASDVAAANALALEARRAGTLAL